LPNAMQACEPARRLSIPSKSRRRIRWVERWYLDICCLKRPFDDQRQARVREEATAVASIVARAEGGELDLVRSPAHLVENDANPREDRRLAAALWIDGAAVGVGTDPEVESRARQLAALGFSPLDALHLAYAEKADATTFLTCDDQLLRLAERHRSDLEISVRNPRATTWEREP